MLDRLISGAGAVTDAADGWVPTRLLRGRPGSLIVAAILFLLAGLLILVGIETTDGPTPRGFDPGQFALTPAGSPAAGLGQRTFATVSGSLASTYVETYVDTNANGTQDDGEDGNAWYYWLVDPARRRGLTVRSTRPPSAIFTASIRGVVIDEPAYVEQDVRRFAYPTKELGLTLEATKAIDARGAPDGTAAALDLNGPLPADGSLVAVSGSRLVQYLAACSGDADGDKKCDPNEVDYYDIVVYDPVGKHAITILTDASPVFQPTTMTGLVRRDERAVDEARIDDGRDFIDLGLLVSEHYLLDEGMGPSSAPLAFGLAAVLGAVGGLILIGLAGGYLIYRRSDGHLPMPATSLAPGERIPLRITGVVHTPTGPLHVREAPGELVRFVLGRPVPLPPAEPIAPSLSAAEVPEGTAGPTAPSDPVAAAPIKTTLLVGRLGRPHGVDVGLGQLTRMSAGQVFPPAGIRPALRLVAGTGSLVLSFATEPERDRAAAELLDETGLGPDGRQTGTS